MLNGYVFVNKASISVGKVIIHKSRIHAQFSHTKKKKKIKRRKKKKQGFIA